MISFDGARLLSYDHDHIFLADNFRYAVRKNLSIEGTIYSLTNEEGVAPVWSGISGMVMSATDYDKILINGYDLGRARVESITFAEGVDVKKKDYTVNVTVYESGNLFNMSGRYYEGLDVNNPRAPIFLLENLSESFSFSLDENGEGEVTQDIDLKFISGGATGSNANPRTMAQLFASGLFYANSVSNLINDEYLGLYDNARKKYFTESYSLITNECSFSCTSKLLNTSGAYYLTYTHSIDTDERGVTTVTENGNILGLYVPLSGSARSGYNYAMDTAFARSSGMFERYKPTNAYPLSSTRLSLERKINNYAGTIDYSVAYSNNPNLQGTYIWEYTQQLDRVDGCNYTVSENGSVKGASTDCDSANLYSRAVAGFITVKSGMNDRAEDFYYSGTHYTKPLKLITKSETKSEFQGSIEYDYRYTDDVNQGVSGFKSVEYTVEDTAPVHLVSKFVIPGVKEIVQPAQNSTLGNRSIKLNIRGGKDKTLADYRNYTKDKFNELIPTGGDVFIKECNYNWQPSEHEFTAQIAWTFFGDRAFESVLL